MGANSFLLEQTSFQKGGKSIFKVASLETVSFSNKHFKYNCPNFNLSSFTTLRHSVVVHWREGILCPQALIELSADQLETLKMLCIWSEHVHLILYCHQCFSPVVCMCVFN